MTIPGYDTWKLAPPDDGDGIGTEEGQTCNRLPEPDEYQPRRFRPMRCNGVMEQPHYGRLTCDTCGEEA